MRPRIILTAFAAIALALGIPPDDARALSVTGNASTQAEGGTTQYVNLTIADSTSGLLQTIGTCSSAKAQSSLSVSAGTQVLLAFAGGSPGPSCIANAYASGNVGYQDMFSVQSGSLAPGTLVDVSLCVHAAIRHGSSFICGGNINEVVANSASSDVSIFSGSTTLAAHGTFSDGATCANAYSARATGLYADSSQTLTLTQVPVGGDVWVSASTSIASGATSYVYPSEAHVEVALVIGYSSTSDVKLISTATTAELNPASLCSDSIAQADLPPNPGVLAVGEPGRGGLELLTPAPNPASGPMSVAFSLPREESAELAVFDITGARVARLVRGTQAPGLHAVVWNGRDESGRAVGAGLYWLRLVTPDGRASRAIVRIR